MLKNLIPPRLDEPGYTFSGVETNKKVLALENAVHELQCLIMEQAVLIAGLVEKNMTKPPKTGSAYEPGNLKDLKTKTKNNA